MNADCIFCKIVAGQLPSCKVYEDADTLAFMDIGPIVPGHTLVIPKKHVVSLADAPAVILQKLIVVAQNIAQAQFRALKADGVNIMQANGQAAGQVVPHLHFHVIPRFVTDGHHWNWQARPYANNNKMQTLAGKISEALQQFRRP